MTDFQARKKVPRRISVGVDNMISIGPFSCIKLLNRTGRRRRSDSTGGSDGLIESIVELSAYVHLLVGISLE